MSVDSTSKTNQMLDIEQAAATKRALELLRLIPSKPELLWREGDWMVYQTIRSGCVQISVWCIESSLMVFSIGENNLIVDTTGTERLAIPQAAFHAVADAMGRAPMRLEFLRKALLDAKKAAETG